MRPRHRTRVLGALVALVGCGGDFQRIAVIPEDWPEGEHWFGALLLEAEELTDTTPLVPSARLGSLELAPRGDGSANDVRVLAWSDAQLDAIGATADARVGTSPLRLATKLDWTLPPPVWSYAATIEDGRSVPFEPGELELTADWCKEIPPCARHQWEAQQIRLSDVSEGRVDYIEPLDSERALVFSRPGIYLVELPTLGAVELTQLSTTTRFLDAVRIGTDVFAISWYGELARIQTEPTLEFATMPALPSGPRTPAAIDGGETENGYELFVVSGSGELVHFDGSRWRTVHSFGRVIGTLAQGLVWMGPGRVAFYEEAPHQLHLWSDDELTTIAIPSRPQSIHHDERIGLWIGSDVSVIFRLEDTRLERINGVPVIGDAFNGLTSYQDGVAVVLNDAVGYFDPVTGWCAARENWAGSTGRIETAAAMGRDLLFGGNTGLGLKHTAVVLLRSAGPGEPLCVPPASKG